MTGIDQPLQRARTAVRFLRGADDRRRRSPSCACPETAPTGISSTAVMPSVLQRIEMRDDRVERSFSVNVPTCSS